MRTTLDIDEDVLLAVKERARREKRSAGAVLSEVARKGLTAPTVVESGRFGFPTLSPRGAAVTNTLID
ncbi:MAG TPA: hypothetical protein VIU11_17555, partial [Nakamurella sp.]